MNSTFKKYFLLFYVLLLSSYTNVYTTSTDSFCSQDSETLAFLNTNEAQSLSFNATQPENDNQLFITEIDSEDVEENIEEQASNYSWFISKNGSTNAVFLAQLFENNYAKLQQNVFRYKYQHSNNAVRLHAKLQVFII
ncbi:hypothetical protein [Tenacibaculum sp. IB213877]|uniref:hypothetical protein n=1 Tax=Tenacibaculum sp. IB213877 TaxID=3097351 RepID=UPI002A5A3C8E|nr:hypothetical protein [Tenacibaculum sp. IB213877]MDY0781521.1 hypothetical protein [Tenacibaculum sp. IB213877]